MTQETLAHNPFMMMLRPDIVLAAVERSEKLGRLNRRLCHPLDRPVPSSGARVAEHVADADDIADAD